MKIKALGLGFVTGYLLLAAGNSFAALSQSNAVMFCDAAGITNLNTRADVLGFADELDRGGIYSNLVEAVFFQPRFNPSNSLTFFRRPMLATNATFYKWGVSMTNGAVTIQVEGLPNCQTNTQIYAWHVPGGMSSVNGDFPGRYLGGLVNQAATQSLYVTANGANNAQVHIRATGRENANRSTDGRNAWILPWTIFNNATFTSGRLGQLMAAGNKLVTAFAYDGSSLSVFQDFWPAQIDYDNPTYSTNYALAGIQISAPLTNLLIGKDFINTNLVGASKSDCLEVLIFNQPLNYSQYKTAWRSMRWLDPDRQDIYIGGDSTMAVNGILPVSATNAPAIYLKQKYDANANILNAYDVSMGADSYGGWAPYFVFNNNAWQTNIMFLSGDFCPTGKVLNRVFMFKAGINDFYFNNLSGSFVASNALWTQAHCRSNGIDYWPMTVGETATNGWLYRQSEPQETHRKFFNNWLVTNFSAFDHVIPIHLQQDQSIMNTNNGYTLDGTHLGGPNAWIVNQRIASAILSSTPAPQLIAQRENNSMRLSWPMDHTGWRLQVQTSSADTGLKANWADVTGADFTNAILNAIDSSQASGFYRLAYP